MATARYYDESKNVDGGMFDGVPLGDLTDEQYEALPEWLQKSVDASPMYRKTPVPKAKPAVRVTKAEAQAEPAPEAERGD